MPQLLYSSDTHFLKLDTTTLKHLINDALCGAECEVVAAIIGALYISWPPKAGLEKKKATGLIPWLSKLE